MKTLTLRLRDDLHDHLKQFAARYDQSVEEYILGALATSILMDVIFEGEDEHDASGRTARDS